MREACLIRSWIMKLITHKKMELSSMLKAAERAFTFTVQKDGAEVKVGTPV